MPRNTSKNRILKKLGSLALAFTTILTIASTAFTDSTTVVNAASTSTTQTFNYNGSYQTYSVPTTGYYILETWGAQGSSATIYTGGKGGYVKSYIYLTSGTTLYLYVGGQNGYNGGGTAYAADKSGYVGNGGGATDIRLNGTALSNRIQVAGGGGGATYGYKGGDGGSTDSGNNNTLGDGTTPAYLGGGGGGGGYYGGISGINNSHQAYGGSNYFNESKGLLVSSKSGQQSGNGVIKITKCQGNSIVINPNGGSYDGSSVPVYIEQGEATPTTISYSESKQTYTATKKGVYKLEVWGARGGGKGDAVGGNGSYEAGTIAISTANTPLYVYTGGTNGYNGGGSAEGYYGNGGGATDIRLGGTSTGNRIIVAGGGGGSNATPVYHQHKGNSSSGGECYTPHYTQVTHGNAHNFSTPAYHASGLLGHDTPCVDCSNCGACQYEAGEYCGDTWTTDEIDYYNFTCTKDPNTYIEYYIYKNGNSEPRSNGTSSASSAGGGGWKGGQTLYAGTSYANTTYLSQTSNSVDSNSSNGYAIITYDSNYQYIETPTRTGYTFAGWSISGGGSFINNGSELTNVSNNTILKYGSSTTVLTANWVKNSNYGEATINPNGGVFNGKTTSTVLTETPGTNLTTTPTRYGYKFTGWTLSGSGSTSGTSYTFSNGTATLKANWEAVSSTLTLDTNDSHDSSNHNEPDNKTTYNDTETASNNTYTRSYGVIQSTINVLSDYTKNYFNKTTHAISNPQRKGYTFQYWTTTTQTDGYMDSSGWHFASKNAKLIAVYTPNTYTVVYDRNTPVNATDTAGRGSQTSNVNKVYDKAFNLNKNSTCSDRTCTTENGYEEGFLLTGWHFVEWNTKRDGSGYSYKSGQSVTNLTPTANGTITLYAIWRPIEYTIVFNGNKNTSGSMDNIKLKFDGEPGTGNPLTLPANKYGRQYTVTYKHTEPWRTDLESKNGTTTTDTAVYTFAGWHQTTDTTNTIKIDNVQLGDTIYYAVKNTATLSSGTGTVSNNYQVTSYNTTDNKADNLLKDQAKVKNLTLKDGATIYLSAAWNSHTITIPSQLTGQNNYNNIGWSTQAYTDARVHDKQIWATDKDTETDHTSRDAVGAAITMGQSYTPYKDITLYAHWSKTVTLTFNTKANGGKYQNSDANVVLTGTFYDYEKGYTFNILSGLTPQSKGKYDKQITKIDAYGKYDRDGYNTKYTKIDSNNTQYRFLGWNLNSASTTPLKDFSITNNSHKTTYNITDNTTLYAIYEPILKVDFSLTRNLGTLNFANGTTPLSRITNVTAQTYYPAVEAIIRPGEKGTYSLTTTENNLEVTVKFHPEITQIYTIKGKWTDNLNPSTGWYKSTNKTDSTKKYEDLIDNQAHGLNKEFPSLNKGYKQIQFYMPQYLGTSQSYPGNSGKAVYYASFTIKQNTPSYFYKTKYNTDYESIRITGIFYLTDAVPESEMYEKCNDGDGPDGLPPCGNPDCPCSNDKDCPDDCDCGNGNPDTSKGKDGDPSTDPYYTGDWFDKPIIDLTDTGSGGDDGISGTPGNPGDGSNSGGSGGGNGDSGNPSGGDNGNNGGDGGTSTTPNSILKEFKTTIQ